MLDTARFAGHGIHTQVQPTFVWSRYIAIAAGVLFNTGSEKTSAEVSWKVRNITRNFLRWKSCRRNKTGFEHVNLQNSVLFLRSDVGIGGAEKEKATKEEYGKKIMEEDKVNM
jgi:hypothetical protein